jgi:hypothetical protein
MFVLDGKTFVLTHRICSVEKHFDYMITGILISLQNKKHPMPLL